MALAYSITTGGTTLNKVWRKVQGSLMKGIQTETEEWSWLDDLKKMDVDVSAREITVPVDLNRAYGTALIPEGGYEANPVTPNVEEVTLTWSNYNQRWTTTLTSRYLSQLGQDNKIVDQFKYQGIKAVEAISNRFGYDFYGFSTGIQCDTSTNATATSGQAYTLEDAFGVSTIDTADYIARRFQVGDRVALIRSAALVTNALGTVTARSLTTPSITVTWKGSVDADPDDSFVFANSIQDTDIAGTDYALAPSGMLDMFTSSSLHSLTHANWVASLADTVAGRYSGVRLRKAKQAIGNSGGGKLTDIIWSQGVSNDVFALQSGSLRFNDPYAMELDGDAKSKGIRFRTSRKVPPGYVFHFDRSSIRKFSLLEMPTEGGTPWNDGDKIEGRNAYAFSIDFPVALVCTNRLNLAYASSVTEQ